MVCFALAAPKSLVANSGASDSPTAEALGVIREATEIVYIDTIIAPQYHREALIYNVFTSLSLL